MKLTKKMEELKDACKYIVGNEEIIKLLGEGWVRLAIEDFAKKD